MHHPHQFNVMAKSFQDDKLRAAAASRAGKKKPSSQRNWRPRLFRPARPLALKQLVSRVSVSFGQLGVRSAK